MITGGRQLDDATEREVKKPQVRFCEQRSQWACGLAVTPGLPLSETMVQVSLKNFLHWAVTPVLCCVGFLLLIRDYSHAKTLAVGRGMFSVVSFSSFLPPICGNHFEFSIFDNF